MGLFDDIFSGAGGIANSLLDTLGTDCIFIKSASTSYDPRLDIYTKGDPVERFCKTSPLLRYSTYEKKDSDIQEGDCKLIGKFIDFSGVVDTQDKVRMNGITYIIVRHSVTYTGKTAATITMQLREEK